MQHRMTDFAPDSVRPEKKEQKFDKLKCSSEIQVGSFIGYKCEQPKITPIIRVVENRWQQALKIATYFMFSAGYSALLAQTLIQP